MFNIEHPDSRTSDKQIHILSFLHVLLKHQYHKLMLPAKIGTFYPGKITDFRKQIFVGFEPKKLATPRRP